jgi:hypothetical protein
MSTTGRFAYVSGGYSSYPDHNSVDYLPLSVDATAPAITQQPVGQFIIAGQPATFSITATGRDPLTYQWRKDRVDPVDGGTISGATTDTLSIRSAQPADACNYDVIVTNGCGAAQSDPATPHHPLRA